MVLKSAAWWVVVVGLAAVWFVGYSSAAPASSTKRMLKVAQRRHKLGIKKSSLDPISEERVWFSETPYHWHKDTLNTSPEGLKAAHALYGGKANWSTDNLLDLSQGPWRESEDSTNAQYDDGDSDSDGDSDKTMEVVPNNFDMDLLSYINSDDNDDDIDGYKLSKLLSLQTLSSSSTLFKPNGEVNDQAQADASGKAIVQDKLKAPPASAPPSFPSRKASTVKPKDYNTVINLFLRRKDVARTPSYNPFTKSGTISDIHRQLQSMGEIATGTLLKDTATDWPLVNLKYFLRYVLHYFEINTHLDSGQLVNSVVLNKFLTRAMNLGLTAKWHIAGLDTATISEWTNRVDNALTQLSDYIVRFLDFLHQTHPEWLVDTKSGALMQFIKQHVTHNAVDITDALAQYARLLASLHATAELDSALIRNLFALILDTMTGYPGTGRDLVEGSLKWEPKYKDLIKQPSRRWQQLWAKTKHLLERGKPVTRRYSV
ncbi:hypothetical protein H4R35_004790 [Dimargaris xerosporica]|nr:hypothetical protein H4R35_004790 [Dimargaris xerosporica]